MPKNIILQIKDLNNRAFKAGVVRKMDELYDKLIQDRIEKGFDFSQFKGIKFRHAKKPKFVPGAEKKDLN